MTQNKERIFLSPPHLGDEELRQVTEAFAINYIAPIGPHLIKLIEHNDGIGGFHLSECLQDTPRHRTDIGSAMTFNFSFVTHSSH